MKQVWVKCATCSVTRWTTSSALLPTPVTAMPEPKSISELPSASMITPPPAAVTKTGQHMTQAAGDAALAALKQFPRDRAGYLGDQVALLRQRGPADSGCLTFIGRG